MVEDYSAYLACQSRQGMRGRSEGKWELGAARRQVGKGGGVAAAARITTAWHGLIRAIWWCGGQ